DPERDDISLINGEHGVTSPAWFCGQVATSVNGNEPGRRHEYLCHALPSFIFALWSLAPGILPEVIHLDVKDKSLHQPMTRCADRILVRAPVGDVPAVLQLTSVVIHESRKYHGSVRGMKSTQEETIVGRKRERQALLDRTDVRFRKATGP